MGSSHSLVAYIVPYFDASLTVNKENRQHKSFTMRPLYCLMCLLFLQLSVQAQSPEAAHPQGYFRNPLDIPIILAGGFAECRPNHFHTGIDIKTNQKENLPVHAAAEGYISRISVSHSGYGNCLYVTHPNGYTTVYGHLNDFFPALQAYTEAQQYKMGSWSLDINLSADQFPIKKNQQIAWSGNTGGSTGPHLHFEIRDTHSGFVLNALRFGLPFKDTRAPLAKSLAVYDAGKSIYEQTPRFLTLKKTGDHYQIPQAIFRSDKPTIRLGVWAQDYTDNSPNWLGIYQMKLFLDDTLKVATLLESIDFAQNRMVNAYADYKTKELKDEWYQGLYRLPNNKLNAYPTITEDGALAIGDGNIHKIKLEMSDPMGNKATLEFQAQYTGKMEQTGMTNYCPDKAIFWDCTKPNTIKTESLSFSTDAQALYDHICFSYTETPGDHHLSNIVQLHDATVPLQNYCNLSLRLNRPVPFTLRSKLIFVHAIKAASLPGNNPQQAMAASYVQGWAQAKIRTFGNYYVQIDTTAPVIASLQQGIHFATAKQLQFKVTEDNTSIKSFDAALDGKWLRFVRRGNTFTYVFDAHCPPGKHTLTISASDENDNVGTFTFNFTR